MIYNLKIIYILFTIRRAEIGLKSKGMSSVSDGRSRRFNKITGFNCLMIVRIMGQINYFTPSYLFYDI